jgi:hypothetical protein
VDKGSEYGHGHWNQLYAIGMGAEYREARKRTIHATVKIDGQRHFSTVIGSML